MDPIAIAVADFSGNGRQDVAVANGNLDPGQVNVLFGNGAGGFAAPVPTTAGRLLTGIATGDFNADHLADIVVSDGSGGFDILLNTGNGNFHPAVHIAGGSSAQAIAAGDFNHDGKLDIALADSGGVLLFPGHGDGTFGPYKVLAAGTAFRQLAIQDVNHDGKPDITATTANVIEVFLGVGSGDFGPAHSHNFSSGRIDSLAFGDFDGDGKLDVAVGLYTPQTGANQVVSLRGRGDGTFLGAGQASPAGPGDAGSIAIEDFNGDGKLDVMVASVNIDQSFGGNSVSVLSGNGDGTFGPPVLYAVGSNPVAIALGTFNADGHVDAVTANMWSFDVTALLADSQGGFRAAKQYVAGPGAAVTLAGDLNGDKNTDLVVMTDSGFSVLLGTGAFQPGSNVAGPGGSAVLASFNDDQALDLAVNCGPNETGSLYLGNGDGTFSPPVGFVAANCGYVINADLNRDGKQDLVSANLGEVVTVLLGAGAGYFQPPAYYAVGNGRGVAGPSPSPTWMAMDTLIWWHQTPVKARLQFCTVLEMARLPGVRPSQPDPCLDSSAPPI